MSAQVTDSRPRSGSDYEQQPVKDAVKEAVQDVVERAANGHECSARRIRLKLVSESSAQESRWLDGDGQAQIERRPAQVALLEPLPRARDVEKVDEDGQRPHGNPEIPTHLD